VIRVRALVVDDSAAYRRIISDTLASDDGIEVVGSASNGKIALARIPQINPDVVTLDVEMPEMDGLETLKQIRAEYPTLPVIMVSSATAPGAEATIDALLRGASDYCMKPIDAEGAATLRAELVPKVLRLGQAYLKALRSAGGAGSMAPGRLNSSIPPAAERSSSLVPAPQPSTRPRPPVPSPTGPRRTNSRIDILAIGVSTGGPNALATVFGALPKTLGVPVVVVQHMPPLFTASLATRLDGLSELAVCEGAAKLHLLPNKAFIAPGNHHMVVVREGGIPQLALHQGQPENSCRPAVDVLFRSVADVFGPGALAVVMTGMGQDGLRGAEHIRDAGGEVWAQDEASSVVWGMPGAVARAGLAARLLPLERLGSEIARRVRESREPAHAVKSAT
jgi:two-component system chemotaxis response regulator CheB